MIKEAEADGNLVAVIFQLRRGRTCLCRRRLCVHAVDPGRGDQPAWLAYQVAGIPGSIAATLGFVFPSVFIVLFLGYLYYKYGNVAAIRGILNGLRPAVVALIGSAGLNFILLAFWNREKLPVDLAKTDLVAVLVFVLAWIAQKKKTGTITLLFSSGVAGLLFYLVTGTHP